MGIEDGFDHKSRTGFADCCRTSGLRPVWNRNVSAVATFVENWVDKYVW
jgi:hypothetical protein